MWNSRDEKRLLLTQRCASSRPLQRVDQGRLSSADQGDEVQILSGWLVTNPVIRCRAHKRLCRLSAMLRGAW